MTSTAHRHPLTAVGEFAIYTHIGDELAAEVGTPFLDSLETTAARMHGHTYAPRGIAGCSLSVVLEDARQDHPSAIVVADRCLTVHENTNRTTFDLFVPTSTDPRDAVQIGACILFPRSGISVRCVLEPALVQERARGLLHIPGAPLPIAVTSSTKHLVQESAGGQSGASVTPDTVATPWRGPPDRANIPKSAESGRWDAVANLAKDTDFSRLYRSYLGDARFETEMPLALEAAVLRQGKLEVALAASFKSAESYVSAIQTHAAAHSLSLDDPLSSMLWCP